MLDLESLDIFRTVVRAGGVLRAAELLHRVPSGVTSRLKQLEQRVGHTLFRRQGRGLVLTAEGQALLGHAQRLLQAADEAEQAWRGGGTGGLLRLGSLESAAGTRLPALLSGLHQRHPQVRVELQTGTSGALLQRLAAFELDAAFVSQPFTAPGLHQRAVFEERLVLITGLGGPPVRVPADLGEATVIAFAQGCSYRQQLMAWLGAGQVLPRRTLEMASYHAIIACVAAGTGCAIVPEAVLAAVTAGSAVQVHALPDDLARNTTHLVWPGDASPALAALIAELPVPPVPANPSAGGPR